MCGRYVLGAEVAEVAARFGVAPEQLGLWPGPRYNIAPSQANPVVVQNEARHVEAMEWGLRPAWAREPQLRYATINARVETVASKPAYRAALRARRCLVPATGYYEWPSSPDGRKTPYYIHLEGDDPAALFAFAGLYEIARGPDGQERKTYTILTTEATAALRPLHARMPVILDPAAETAWLTADGGDPAALLALLAPGPGGRLAAYPVAPAVNSAAHEGPALIAPLPV